MKLASLKAGGPDGTLVVVSRDLTRAVPATGIAPDMRTALDNWDDAAPALGNLSVELEAGTAADTFVLELAGLTAPLPRAGQFFDGSAYLNHIELARRARGDSLPETLETDPLMYQGASEPLAGCRDAIDVLDDKGWGVDFEAETAVITGPLPMGAGVKDAAAGIRLLMLLNDVSLRRLIPAELEKGFGFVHGKPPSSFSPVAVTPDELGSSWDGAKLHGRLVSTLNGTVHGEPDCGVEMQFGFPALIAHAARARPLCAGTIVGSGTVSNADRATGSSCILERRMIEKIDNAVGRSPFMMDGDRIELAFRDAAGGDNPFGTIDQTVRRIG